VLHTGDLGEALRAARAGSLDAVAPTLFHPLGFMLAAPVETPAEALERMSPAATDGDPAPAVALHVEDKFDGMRAQVHCDRGRVALYSRNREDITASFPELAAAFAAFPARAILDGEVLGWDHATQRALPFATFSARLGRKKVARELLQSTPVAFLAFDCLFARDAMLLDEPLSVRRAALTQVLQQARDNPLSPSAAAETPQTTLFALTAEPAPLPAAPILLAPVTQPESVDDLEAAFLAARERGNEGLMIKNPNSLYTPGRRGYAWLKLKRELATLDVVITGAEFGHGRRAGILSDYTFAVQDAGGELLNVGKAYSGLTDAEIAELSAWCMAHTLQDFGHFRTVEPHMLLEVAFNNVMRSERHNSGFALRFPRIVRLRPDKPLAEIDSLARVEEIYQSQPDKVSSSSPDS
jgi:DNA ligase-1